MVMSMHYSLVKSIRFIIAEVGQVKNTKTDMKRTHSSIVEYPAMIRKLHLLNPGRLLSTYGFATNDLTITCILISQVTRFKTVY